MRLAVGMGSNLGDRLSFLRRAAEGMRERLHDPGAAFLKSRVYETAPVGCEADAPFFYNAAVEFECGLGPLEALDALQTIEQELGRPAAHGFHLPRTIDLDMLYFGAVRMSHPRLVLPHPRLMDRAFVLAPLRDIAPDAPIPGCPEGPARRLALLPDAPNFRLVSVDWREEIEGRP